LEAKPSQGAEQQLGLVLSTHISNHILASFQKLQYVPWMEWVGDKLAETVVANDSGKLDDLFTTEDVLECGGGDTKIDCELWEARTA
jgi:hypothetical protein